MTQPNWLSEDQVRGLIDDALNKEREAHAAEMATRDAQIQALQQQNKALVTTSIPEHSGGPGNETAETWSQYEQEQARAS